MNDNDIFDIENKEDIQDTGFADQLEEDREMTKDLDALANGNKGDPYEIFSNVIDEDRDRDHLEYTAQPDGPQEPHRPKLDSEYDGPGAKRSGKSIRQKVSEIDDRLLRKKAEQEAVALFTACGFTQATQAQLLGMSLNQLRKIYGRELTFGKDMLISRVANSMVQKAIDGNVAAAQFILKSKGGWKESTHLEISTGDGEISDIEREQRLMRILLRNPGVQAKLLEQKRIAELTDVTPEPENDIFDL